MTVKEYLQRYADAERVVRRLEREYEKESELIDNIRSGLGGDGTPRGSGTSREVEEKAIRLAEKALEWKEAKLEAIQIRQEVFEAIQEVSGDAGDVLYERYINLKSWKNVADSVGYSKSQTHALHRKGLALVKVRTQSDTYV